MNNKDDEFMKMFENGLWEEFNHIIELGATKDMQSMKAIGYKELFAVLENEASLQEAKEQICLNSRRYAKRQMTWFRGMERRGFKIHWIDYELKMSEKVEQVLSLLNNDKKFENLKKCYCKNKSNVIF